MIRGAGAGGRVVQLARTRFGKGDELLDVGRGNSGMHHKHEIGIVHRRHADEIAQQRVGLVRHQRFIDRLGVRHHQQGVAVGRGLGDEIGANDRTGARLVLDDEGLPENALQLLRHVARIVVGWPARGERHDDAHGLRRIGLRGTAAGEQAKRQRDQQRGAFRQ